MHPWKSCTLPLGVIFPCCLLSVLLGCHLLGSQAAALTLYQETFDNPAHPGGGDQPISGVGWANDVPANDSRWYETGGNPDAAAWSWHGEANTEAFYSSTTLDTGSTGTAFPTIDPAENPSLAFNVDLMSTFAPELVDSFFAVEIGGSWYVSATALADATDSWVTQTMSFDPTAANWNELTVSGDGSATEAIIGAAAGADLSGSITGAGMVFTRTASATTNFDNFVLTGEGGLVPGDTNGDGIVDIETDFEAIRTNFLLTDRTRLQGDLTGEGTVNVYDFAEWKDAYLMMGGSLESIPPLVAVPEPASAVLLLLGAAAAWRRRSTIL